MEHLCLIFNLIWIFTIIFLIRSRYLIIIRDAFFLLFLFIFYIYIHLFPCVYLFNGHKEDSLTYIYIQFQIILFFEIPLILFYKYLVSKIKLISEINFDIIINKSRINIFLLFALFLNIVFLYVSIMYGLFFRRIGHEALMYLSLQVPGIPFFIYRIFEETAVFVTLIFHLILRYSYENRKKIYFVFIFFLSTILIYQLLNSRLQLLVTIFSHTIILISFNRIFIFKKIIKIGIISIIGVFSVMVFRSILVLQDANLESIAETVSDENSLDNRLNGIMLISDINNEIHEKGLMYGKAWGPSIKVIYYYIFDKEESNKIKQNLNTTPKVNIINYYKGNNIQDMPSSLVTDLYPNFGIIGLFLGAFLFSFLFYYITKGLINPKTIMGLVIALYLIPLLIQVEKEFLSMIFMILKYSSILLIILFIKPFTINIKNKI